MQVKRKGNTLVIEINGDLDYVSASALKENIAKEWQRGIVQNYLFVMKAMKFMDSSGLGLLLGRYREAIGRGGKIALSGVVSQAERILELSGINEIIPVFATEAEALKYLER